MAPDKKSPAAGGAITGQFVLLQLLNGLALVGAIAVLIVLHERFQKSEAVMRAREVADSELRRMRSAFNYRLNELREELVHLYGEQSNLARALTEAERERLIFYRRDHLAAYGVLVQNDEKKWEVQKYYVRDTARKAGANLEDVVRHFKETMAVVQPPGFGLKRVTLDPKSLGMSWPEAADSHSYAVAFVNPDDAGRPFGLVGFFRASYVFQFCRAFGEPLGAMPTTAFVTSDTGRAICHSQAKYEGADLKDFGFYKEMKAAVEGAGQSAAAIRYTNALGNNVTAQARRIEPGGLSLVAEAGEVSPWALAVPARELAVVSIGLLGVFVLIGSLGGKALASRAARHAAAVSDDKAKPEEPVAMPKTDALGVELGEFTKLQRELKELEATILDMQSNEAYLATYQKDASELSKDAELGRFTVDYLRARSSAVAWIAYVANERALVGAIKRGWASDDREAFRLEIAPGQSASELVGSRELLEKTEKWLGVSELVLQPVIFQSELIGVLVLRSDASKLETLPQLAQTMAFIAAARESRNA